MFYNFLFIASFIVTVHAAEKDIGNWKGRFTTNTPTQIEIVHTPDYIKIENLGYLHDVTFYKGQKVCGIFLENGLTLKIKSTYKDFVKALKDAGIYEEPSSSDLDKRPYN